MSLFSFFSICETYCTLSRWNLGTDLVTVEVRVVVTPSVVLLLRDFSGLQLGGLLPSGPEHLVQSGSIRVLAETHLQGKYTILFRDFQPVVVLQGKQGVHEPNIGVYIRDRECVGGIHPAPVPGQQSGQP